MFVLLFLSHVALSLCCILYSPCIVLCCAISGSVPRLCLVFCIVLPFVLSVVLVYIFFRLDVISILTGLPFMLSILFVFVLALGCHFDFQRKCVGWSERTSVLRYIILMSFSLSWSL